MKIRLVEDVLWRDLVDEVVILDLKSGTYFGLEGVGNDIWRLIAKYSSRDKVLKLLTARYDVAPERLVSDFDALVGELAQKGLVRVTDDSTTVPADEAADRTPEQPQAGEAFQPPPGIKLPFKRRQ